MMHSLFAQIIIIHFTHHLDASASEANAKEDINDCMTE